jgi:hypothetical protein
MPRLAVIIVPHSTCKGHPVRLAQESGFLVNEGATDFKDPYCKEKRSPRARDMSFWASKLENLGSAVEKVLHPALARNVVHQLIEGQPN